MAAPQGCPEAPALERRDQELQTRMSPTNCALAPSVEQADLTLLGEDSATGTAAPLSPGLPPLHGQEQTVASPTQPMSSALPMRPGFDGTVRTQTL